MPYQIVTISDTTSTLQLLFLQPWILLFHSLQNMQKSKESDKKPISVGPWGGQDGFKWDDGVYSTIRQLVISHGSAIDSIQIEYDKKGNSIWSGKHGGNGGNKVDKVKLEYPNEFLTSIHGHYGPLHDRGAVAVRSLTFESNKRSYGPFGAEQGTPFFFPMAGGKIVGFHGRSGWFLDAIGVYLKPSHKLNRSNALVQTQSYVTSVTEKKAAAAGYSIIQGSIGQDFDIVLAVKQKGDHFNIAGIGSGTQTKLLKETNESHELVAVEKTREKIPSVEKVPPKIEGLVSCGPWGGSGGAHFVDGVCTGIRQINVSRNVGIVSIKPLYDWNGEAVWGSKHGGTGGYRTEKVVFDYPNEILTHITGTYGSLMYMGPNIIKSITFHTNKGKYGPFGEEQGQAFTSNIREGKIVGFQGKEGLFVDAIGVFVIQGKVPPYVVSPPISKNKNEADVAAKDHGQLTDKLGLPKHGPTQEVAYGHVKEQATYVAETDHGQLRNKLGLPRRGPTQEVAYGHVKEQATYVAETDHGQLTNKLGLPRHGHTQEVAYGQVKEQNTYVAEADHGQLTNKLGLPRRGPTQEVAFGLVKEPAPYGPGPWGGEGGRAWDDGVFTGIRQIFLTRGAVICSIQLEYERNGQSVWSAKHGGDGGKETHRIKLECPNEVLTRISGYYNSQCKEESPRAIKSLTFYTSRGKYGPFGEEVGTFFTSTTTEGKVVGFHGRSSAYLDAIGVHMQHWLGNQKPAKPFYKRFS